MKWCRTTAFVEAQIFVQDDDEVKKNIERQKEVHPAYLFFSSFTASRLDPTTGNAEQHHVLLGKYFRKVPKDESQAKLCIQSFDVVAGVGSFMLMSKQVIFINSKF